MARRCRSSPVVFFDFGGGDDVDSNGPSSEGDQTGSSAVAETRGGLSPTHRPANAVDETNQGYNHSAPFPVFHMNRIGEETQFFRGNPLTGECRKYDYKGISKEIIKQIVFDSWRDACRPGYDPKLAEKTDYYREQLAEWIVHIPVETATAPVE